MENNTQPAGKQNKPLSLRSSVQRASGGNFRLTLSHLAPFCNPLHHLVMQLCENPGSASATTVLLLRLLMAVSLNKAPVVQQPTTGNEAKGLRFGLSAVPLPPYRLLFHVAEPLREPMLGMPGAGVVQ